jgi:DNA-binding CsgD family transcriptional regulator
MKNELSEREKQVLCYVAAGLTNKTIAGILMISEPTVENHIHHIYGKLGILNRAQATAYAFKNGLMNPNNRNDK